MKLLHRLAAFIASGAGSGYSPVAPGTLGTLTCLILWWAAQSLFSVELSLKLDFVVIAAVIVVGTLSTQLVLDQLAKGENPSNISELHTKKEPDPQFVVIDEWAGLLISLVGISASQPFSTLSAFLLFRFFDIFKPAPVSTAERLPGAIGIMGDDVVAGVYAALTLKLLRIVCGEC